MVLSDRASPTHHARRSRASQVSDRRHIAVPFVGFPFVIFVSFVVIALTTPAATPRQTPEPRVVNVTAERFSFTPSEIRLKVNEPIEIRLRSEDTDHGFRILDTDHDVRIPKRGKGTATVTFRPTREGRYTFECSHICGAGHGFMRGTLIVSK